MCVCVFVYQISENVFFFSQMNVGIGQSQGNTRAAFVFQSFFHSLKTESQVERGKGDHPPRLPDQVWRVEKFYSTCHQSFVC